MKSLLNKSLTQFVYFTTVILLLSAPLFFLLMKHFYTEDLDELVWYRSDEFIQNRVGQIKEKDIVLWNEYNEDMQLLPDTFSYPENKIVQQFFYNAAEKERIDYRVLYRKVGIEGCPYVLMSKISLIETKDLLKTLLFQYGLILLILLISLTLILRFISNRLWKPFNEALSLIDQFNLEGEAVPHFYKSQIKEFDRLNTALTRLIEDNLKVYKSQKEFIENASHELQTPLAVFQTKLDMLLQQSDLTEMQAEIVQSLYGVTARLSRLNKNLLLLAKIENKQQFCELQSINLPEAVEGLYPYLIDLSDGIELKLEIRNRNLWVTANETLLESLLNNLIVNAIRHGEKGGDISIRIEGYELVVSNPGTAPLDKDRLFRRFYRPSEIKRGNGLGLAIVESICRFHHWTIDYRFVHARHCFIVRFESQFV